MAARTEGMGSGIPIKFAREVKTTKWVLSYAGETCSCLSGIQDNFNGKVIKV